MRRLAVIFGDQLDRSSAVFDDFDRERDALLMMEIEQESTHVPSHRQRTAMFLAAMRHFALELHEAGHRVQYVRLDDPHNTQCFDGEVRRQTERLRPDELTCTLPGEWRVLHLVENWKEELAPRVEIRPDRHFLVQPDEFSTWAKGRRSLVMEHFYREQRKRLDILMTDDGQPTGGQWNFDADNRQSFAGAPSIRRPYRARPDAITREVMAMVERRLPNLPGRMASLPWPVTRDEAKRALDDFIDHRLPRFGAYQDAMWTEETTLYHSRLSAALNLKLLDPRDAARSAIAAYESGAAPLNSVEGFVRQIIGWREFIRGVYWYAGPEYERRNGLEHHGDLPALYWSGETDLECLRQSIGQVLDESYGHHIQRLMITGNFALIAGVHPKKVSDWYLGMYTDAVDWVTLPNTLGMAMHADGGVVGTKPYAASGKYVKRMSNYCDHCPYDVKRRTGEAACPFNTFYWDFLIRHRQRFAKNHRMRMILANVDRMADDERRTIVREAAVWRERLGIEG
ncbi:MAG: cryptochrome/photolyase family protein [Planctomycetes bacterium]|nr:cryptochrome/photolyase family protein [Planctomycetota bacterium]